MNRRPGRSGTAAASGASEDALIAAGRRLLELGGVEPESRFASVHGLRLHYLEVGEGSPVALIQGAGGGAANWYRLLGPLSRRFRVCALDLPGFGRSDPVRLDPPLGPRAAALVDAWLADLGVQRCDIVGTSFGGLIALRMALTSASRVRRLVLMDSVGLGRELPVLVRLATLPVVGRLGTRASRRGTAALFRHLLTTHPDRIPADERDALIDYLWRSSAAGDARVLAAALRAFASARGQREVLSDAELDAIRARTLVLWGEDDRFLPAAHGRRAVERIPRARLEVVQNAGHSPNWEAPDAVLDALIPFLAG